MLRTAQALLALASLAGCYASHEAEGAPAGGETDSGWDGGPPGAPDGGPGPIDAGPGRDAALDRCDDGTPVPSTARVGVDLLLVMDSSDSMIDEQVRLTSSFPAMVTALVTGDGDGDGARDFPAAPDLRVGVVTTDLGVGIPTRLCEDPDGDDGILQTTSRAERGCGEDYPTFLSFTSGGSGSLADFAHDVGCVTRVGTEGCPVEQPFEAALKALTPSSSDLRFTFGSPTGHGDGANGGFLREEAVLAVLLITDEDDCSFHDPDLWNPSSAHYEGNLRCRDYEEEALHRIDRFVDGLRALKPDPDRLVVGAITGVPTDLLPPTSHTDYAAILADPRMDKRADPRYPDQLQPACGRPEVAMAEPSVRIVRAMRALGPSGLLLSICESSFDSPLRQVAARIGWTLRRLECRGP